MSPATRWWVSWYEPGEDYRPAVWPLPRSVLGYWCSGWTDDKAALCAWVEADTAEQTWEILTACWPSECPDRRFERQHPDAPGSRFPPPKWAVADGRWP